MIITIIAKLFGFAGEIALSYFYGTSSISDAYLISLTIPSVLFSLIGVGISTGYIPVYNNVIKEKGINHADRFTNNLISFLMTLCFIIITLTLIFTKQIVGILASGFTGETLRLTILFTRIAILNLGFTGLVYIFNGYLQINGDFISPAIMVIPLNMTILLSIVISAKTNVVVLSIGNTLSVLLQFLLLIPFIRKKGFRYSFVFDKADKYIKKISYLAVPIIIGASVSQINRLIDRSFASNITIGGVSAINYAFKLDAFIQDIFVMTLATIMYPMISKMAAEKNIEGLKKTIFQTMGGINLFVIPASIGALIFAEPIIILLFGRGAFDSQAISMTSKALFFYSIGMIGYGLREILLRAFYSLQGTKAPLFNALIAIGLNVILNMMFYKYLGISGIALATSISIIFSTLLLFISFRRKVGGFGMKTIGISLIKILIASSIMGLIAKTFYYLLNNYIGGNLSLLLSIGVGAIIYFIIIIFMRIEEVDIMVKALKKKFRITRF
jgi:putative peptidoglycan lipid II flippase